MHNRYEWDRLMWEEERKLLQEVTDGREPLSWRKFGKMIRLNAMLRSHSRYNHSIYGDNWNNH